MDISNLPHSIEAEQSVLGAILIDPKSLNEVMPILKPQHFYLAQHRAIYEKMIMLFQFSKPIDFITLLEELKSDNVYDETTGKSYLLQLGQLVPSVKNIRRYAEIVREKHDIRELILVSRQTIQNAEDGSGSANELLDAASGRISEIRESRDIKGLRKISEVISVDFYGRIEKLNSPDADKYAGVPTGISGLDAVLDGLHPSDLIILAARPAVGKTSMATNFVTHAGSRCRKRVCFFSLEMSAEQLVSRMISSISGVDNDKLHRGRMLDASDWKNIAQAADFLAHSDIYIDDTGGISPNDIRSKIIRLGGVDLVVIDHLGLMTPDRRKENRVQEISEITRSLKLMAKDLDLPILVLSQLSRESAKRTDHMPQLSDLRDSGSIEQDADVVLLLYREKYFEKEDSVGDAPADPNSAKCIIAKNRHGRTETIPLYWQGQYTRFVSLDDRH
ncbi:MAG: replicative DNA helicase [Clostridia bacterium]|nr:replicative DNA helicase [Clostridia bacterium]